MVEKIDSVNQNGNILSDLETQKVIQTLTKKCKVLLIFCFCGYLPQKIKHSQLKLFKRFLWGSELSKNQSDIKTNFITDPTSRLLKCSVSWWRNLKLKANYLLQLQDTTLRKGSGLIYLYDTSYTNPILLNVRSYIFKNY